MESKQQRREEPGGEESRVNVGTTERVGSAIGGGALVAYGLTRRSLGGALLAGLGGVLAWRGVTGSCPVYRAVGMSTAGESASPGKRLDEGGTTVERVVTVNRTPDEVYAFWRNLANLPKFMSHLASVEVLDGERSHWIADGPAGSRVAWDAVITDDRPNELIAWSSMPDSELLNSGRVEFTRSSDSTATEVRITLRYAPPSGKVGAALAKLLGADPAVPDGVEGALQGVGGDQRFAELVGRAGELPEVGIAGELLGRPLRAGLLVDGEPGRRVDPVDQGGQPAAEPDWGVVAEIDLEGS